MTATPTIGFVIDMMRNMASVVMGFLRFDIHQPLRFQMRDAAVSATSVTEPEKSPASMWRCMSS